MSKSSTATLPIEQPPYTQELQAGTGIVLMFERLAKDPAVDVDKLERLIQMQERIMRHNAKAAFEAAYAQMQSEIPEIDERGQISVKGTVRSTYAKLEDISKVIKPILKAHGFSLRHRTEWPGNDKIRIVGILSHVQGHSEESTFEAPADKSDYRTDVQSMGSTVSYGRRYTTLDLLNLVTRGVDDDGKKSGRPQPPEGYEDWWTDMTAVAESGIQALEQAWQPSHKTFKEYTLNANKDAWRQLKEKAQKVKPS